MHIVLRNRPCYAQPKTLHSISKQTRSSNTKKTEKDFSYSKHISQFAAAKDYIPELIQTLPLFLFDQLCSPLLALSRPRPPSFVHKSDHRFSQQLKSLITPNRSATRTCLKHGLFQVFQNTQRTPATPTVTKFFVSPLKLGIQVSQGSATVASNTGRLKAHFNTFQTNLAREQFKNK